MFYVQYAHARSRGTARNAVAAGVERRWTARTASKPRCWTTRRKTSCSPYLGSYPSIVAKAAELREPHRWPATWKSSPARTTAGTTHAVWRPKATSPSTDVNRTRLWLNDATSQVLANGLDLLGVSAPERM